MLTRQPSSTASRSSSSGGSRRSGRELISTAVPVLSTGAEDGLGVEARRLAALAGDEPARAMAEDVGVGVLHGRDHAPGHLRRLHAQLRVDAGDDDVEPGQKRLVLVERPVLEDVDLYPRQYPKRRHLLVQLLHHLQLLRSRSALSPWATVRRGLWSVSTR